MNILEYIDSLIDQGYSEEDAMVCAACMYPADDDFESDEYEGGDYNVD